MTASTDDLLERLARAEGRLRALATSTPAGLTSADEKTGERWEPGQAWGHIAEFVPYWHGQIERVLEPGAMRPVSFGRVINDPDRLEAIEAGRGASPAAQMARVTAAVAAFRSYLSSLSDENLSTTGTHPIRGEMDVRTIAERFVVSHLEEHADQLDGLRAPD